MRELVASAPLRCSASRAYTSHVKSTTGFLSSLAGVPHGEEEARAFLQRRIAQCAALATLLSLGFYVVSNTMFTLMDPARHPLSAWVTHTINLVHLPSIAATAWVWWCLSLCPRTVLQLSILDVMLWVALTVAYTYIGVQPDAQINPDLLQLAISGGAVVVVRAVFVPSPPVRTLLVSALCFVAPLVGVVYLVQAYPTLMAQLWTVPTWFGAWIAIATVTSKAIFGLRRRAQEAMQLGQYVLERKLGEGGMGAVYEASHALLRRRTAVKLLPVAKAGEANVARFEREVQMTSQLTHPNTVAIYDYGRTPDGIFYYAMELLDGFDLEKLVVLDGPQPAERVVHILKQVCGALAEAHGRGLIHRDVKPANILLTHRGGIHDVAKVVDFGLVKEIRQDADAGVTSANVITGTPLYMSPESIKSPSAVDAASDIYALGGVAYYLLSGAPPFDAATVVEICSHHLHTIPGRIDGVRPALMDVVLACMEKDPKRRPASAAELAERLDACVAEPWTQLEAEAWWRARPDDEPVESGESGSRLNMSIVVDLPRRRTPAA